jgi:hypothetical protein
MKPDRLNFQALYQQRWSHLQQPHVRSLAWLLDSPVLLNVQHARWLNQLAQLPPVSAETKAWLIALDQTPEPLLAFLAVHPHTRLGHYAENLLAFYFKWRGELVAHSVQVRAHTTIGEFDFLLNTPDGFEHWEFACKFYLFVEPAQQLSDFVGPNLMDNLNDKSHKIMDAQLALGAHKDAQKYLTHPLSAAKALLKGWLFYPASNSPSLSEVEPQHCRGIWCRLSELSAIDGDKFAVLSRLNWLAPAKLGLENSTSQNQLNLRLTQQFLTDSRPVLIAQLVERDGYLLESERIFVVPDDWNKKSG